jgi:predicted RNase H-like nuclease
VHGNATSRAAGVDGCRTGWVVVHDGRAWVAPDFAAVLRSVPDDVPIGVDIPIGLWDDHVPGGRDADRAARRILGQAGRSSVFSAPVRRAFGSATLVVAQERGCRMTLQSFNIMGKVAEVDRVMTPALQRRVFEVFPEMAFRALNRDAPLGAGKRDASGRRRRVALLERAGIPVPARPRAGEAEDDVLDACAAAWSADRVSRGVAVRVPEPPPVDSHGLRMEIWH